jgi:hypothetical protein
MMQVQIHRQTSLQNYYVTQQMAAQRQAAQASHTAAARRTATVPRPSTPPHQVAHYVPPVSHSALQTHRLPHVIPHVSVHETYHLRWASHPGRIPGRAVFWWERSLSLRLSLERHHLLMNQRTTRLTPGKVTTTTQPGHPRRPHTVAESHVVHHTATEQHEKSGVKNELRSRVVTTTDVTVMLRASCLRCHTQTPNHQMDLTLQEYLALLNGLTPARQPHPMPLAQKRPQMPLPNVVPHKPRPDMAAQQPRPNVPAQKPRPDVLALKPRPDMLASRPRPTVNLVAGGGSAAANQRGNNSPPSRLARNTPPAPATLPGPLLAGQSSRPSWFLVPDAAPALNTRMPSSTWQPNLPSWTAIVPNGQLPLAGMSLPGRGRAEIGEPPVLAPSPGELGTLSQTPSVVAETAGGLPEMTSTAGATLALDELPPPLPRTLPSLTLVRAEPNLSEVPAFAGDDAPGLPSLPPLPRTARPWATEESASPK